jgi:hypothetical protein
MTEISAHDRKQRRLLILVAVVFFAPLAVSFIFYYGSFGWRPKGHVNKGELIEPVRPTPEQALNLADGGTTNPKVLRGKWTFLYVEQGKCEAECRKHLYDTRQVRLALDREMGRAQRLLIAPADCCDVAALKVDHPDLIRVIADTPAQAILSKLPTDAADPHRVYLLDPLGNLMMFYPASAPSKGMLSDIKRLLQFSQIG